MNRKISQAGIDLIKSFEGCRLKAYKPVPTEPYWTIGWGHYGPDVKEGSTITQAQADQMLVDDLPRYAAYVANPSFVPVTAQLNQNQFDALTSFCYNCGSGNLRSLCKGRTLAQISESILKYNLSSGKVLAGLTRRRKAEQALFNKTVSVVKEENKMKGVAVTVKVDGKKVADGVLEDGTTNTSVRAVAEALGAKVTYDAASKTVNITK